MRAAQQTVVGIVIAILLLFVQSTLLRFVLPDHFVPNLCLLFVVFLSFHEPSVAGAVLSFLIGLLFDVSAGVLLGPWSAAFTALFSILTLLSRRIYLESIPASLLVGFMSALLATTIYTGLLYQFQPAVLDVPSLLIECGVTACVAPLLLRVFYELFVQRFTIYGSRGAGGGI